MPPKRVKFLVARDGVFLDGLLAIRPTPLDEGIDPTSPIESDFKS
jgi:hypothetical protein